MSWVRIEDSMMDHPKMLEAGPTAVLIHLWAMCYSARFLTDGFVTQSVTQLCPWVTTSRHRKAAISRLLSTGLWHEEQGGYRIHDYLEYNPNAASVKTKREADRERQRKWREGNPQARHGVTNSVSHGVSHSAPSPYISKEIGGHTVTASVHICPQCGLDKRTAAALTDHLELVHDV